jgi:hypothetical protein
MKDAAASLTAMGIVFGGGAFLYFTLGLDGARVESVHLIISGLMGSAATFLFGDAAQRRANENQPTITTTSGPPATTTVSNNGDPARSAHVGDPYETVR